MMANPTKWSNMHALHLNEYFTETVYLTDEDLLDIEDSPHDLNLFFGPHLVFHLADGGAILQHRRPETTAFIAASDARAEAQAEWEAAKEALSETVGKTIIAHYAEGDASHHPDSNVGRWPAKAHQVACDDRNAVGMSVAQAAGDDRNAVGMGVAQVAGDDRNAFAVGLGKAAFYAPTAHSSGGAAS